MPALKKIINPAQRADGYNETELNKLDAKWSAAKECEFRTWCEENSKKRQVWIPPYANQEDRHNKELEKTVFEVLTDGEYMEETPMLHGTSDKKTSQSRPDRTVGKKGRAFSFAHMAKTGSLQLLGWPQRLHTTVKGMSYRRVLRV